MHTELIQRTTRQRQVILEEVRRSKSHPTADEIYDRVRAQLPRISLGTVYRNLDLLAANGEIVKLTPGRTQMRFDGNLNAHYHMTCIHCGRVEDLPISPSDSPIDILEQMTSHLTKYGVFGHKLEFVGVCSECAANGHRLPESTPVGSDAGAAEGEQ
ncbi:MAG: transcriptional repressor [Deltaproteobacteria bacterium]|nr:transcriptional repressor [Deltaproteobacteria bacterium]